MTKKSFFIMTLVVLSALLIAFTYYAYQDDPLNPEIAEFEAKYGQTGSLVRNGWIFLLGIDANLNQDPFKVGMARYNRYLAGETAAADAPTLFISELNEDHPCINWSEECIANLDQYVEDFKAILEQNQVLRLRLDQLLMLSNFDNIFNADAKGVLDYNFTAQEMLSNLVLMELIIGLNPTNANGSSNVDRYFNIHKKLLSSFKGSSPIIFKTVLTIHFDYLTQIFNQLNRQNKLNEGNINKLFSNLDEIQKEALSEDYEMQVRLLELFNLIKIELNNSKWPMSSQLFFKINRTLNKAYEANKVMSQGWLADRDDYLLKARQEKKYTHPYDPFNIVGSGLLRISQPLFLGLHEDYRRTNVLFHLTKLHLKYRKQLLAENDTSFLQDIPEARSQYDNSLPFFKDSDLCFAWVKEDQPVCIKIR